MRRIEDRVLLSPSDLNTFFGCHHATALDYRSLDEHLETVAPDEGLRLLQLKGIAHERAYLGKLQAEGRQIAEISDKLSLAERVEQTVAAMRAGADVVYQAAFLDGMWHGLADFLIKRDTPSDLGAWSYDVSDTKLSTHLSAKYAVQLSIYCDLVGSVQGLTPAAMSIVLGDGRSETLLPDDFVHYIRQAKRRLESFLADASERTATVPDPCSHCDMCRWKDRCKAEWDAADHLSLVANIRASQREALVAVGITTVAALASMPEGLAVKEIKPEILSRLRTQARLQVSVRGTDEHRYELRKAAPGRAFERIPRPAEGDLFFDMEGDPLYEGRLEYLFGVHIGDPKAGEFKAFWGHDRAAEKRAFEEFIDFVVAHLADHPDAYIYHYNHYEVTAVRRLAHETHMTRRFEVDDLLHRNKFVDLLKVVTEGVLVSEPRYSLKNIEHFYMPKREGAVANAGDSIVAYERWRVTGEQHILDEIEDYNAIDCRSTAALRDWLLKIRPEGAEWFTGVVPDDESLTRRAEAEAERNGVEAALTAGVPEQDRSYRQLVADLVDFHRREQSFQWFTLFQRQKAEEDQLIHRETECLGGLTLVGDPVPEKRSLLHTYSFPEQETKLRPGIRPLIVENLQPAGSIEALDRDLHTIVLKRGKAKGPLPPFLNIGPPGPVEDKVLRAAIRRFADSVVANDGKFKAVERLLRREPPRLKGRAPGSPIIAPGHNLVAGTAAAVGAMDQTHLFIQGPPGTGKTHTSSHVIVEMMRQGKTIGVASNSHHAIINLLKGIEKVAKAEGFRFKGYKKSGDDDSAFGGDMIVDVYSNDEVTLDDAQLIAGTAWLFARPEFEQIVDYLFVDEAGQVALANIVAMGTSARNIVLVGDQMQLSQPTQAEHPDGSGANALDHLLQGERTVAADHGIFLDETYRMHPSLCGWVSSAIYEGRLKAAPSTAGQALLLDRAAHPALTANGLRFITVDHTGRGQRSPEEAETVLAIWTSLMGQRWRDQHGVEQDIGCKDVLVVAPYNVQVNTIRDVLPDGARVGTVDKFQGQEAAVVIVSMTTSSGDDIPRGIDFLFSRNRLNVAVSRARCLAVVLASPRLLEVSCGSVDDMRAVDTLCHAYEWSGEFTPVGSCREVTGMVTCSG